MGSWAASHIAKNILGLFHAVSFDAIDSERSVTGNTAMLGVGALSHHNMD